MPDLRPHDVPAGRGCPTGKVAYGSRKLARAFIRRYSRRGLHAYRCGECSLFHVGHQPARVRNGEVPKEAWLEAIGRGQ